LVNILTTVGSVFFLWQLNRTFTADFRFHFGSCFFFSRSGKTCNKAATDDYNARILETKVTSLMIADHCHSIMKPGHITYPTLAQIKNQMNKNFDEMLELSTSPFNGLKVVKLCSNRSLSGDQILIEIGQLMNESHDSCSNLYECSCPEVDTLVAHANSFGSLIGSRMTRAGLGGVVSLVPE
ncbi:LOW QUALITY PROTEIN: N-acetylgalactosamine kinase-like, partial [Tetranychus urticae]|uniref:LOW QUALITY PROTEIN: N-acetylgalactosamine kinase-like n=1 Tax=Tetranychus urticae TaxID=32264 RepID=UPI000D65B1B4